MEEKGKKGRMDYTLLLIVVLLVVIGLVILYSTSAYNGQVKFHDSFYYLKKQAFATVLGIVLMLFVAGMAFSVRSQGNTPVGALSMCFSSILFSVASLMYGWKSFKEEEKNYIFAKIGTILSGLLVIWWIVTILIGIRG